MSREENLEIIRKILEPLLVEDIFLVDIKIKPTNNIKIYLDADGGLPIERCTKINRRLYKVIEETELFPDGNFSLEVSSPGITEPLKLHRQYLKNIGRELEVIKNDESKVLGKLINVDDEFITLEYTEGKNKKAVVHQQQVPLSEIKSAFVQIKF
jgi:ribosome maturation factor RimP